jgi:antitoxin VapB
LAELDRCAEVPLFEDGRNEPPAPAGEDILG